MFNSEIRKLLVQVISSWQVLAVTGVLVVYISLVNHVARIYHKRRRSTSLPKLKIKKEKAKEEAAASGAAPAAPESEDLVLEE